MEDILLSDSDMNCLSISSNDFCCGADVLPVRLRLTLLEAAARALGLLPRGRRQGALDGKVIFPPSSPMTMTLTVWPSVRYSCRSLT